jgi:hypothetical protein
MARALKAVMLGRVVIDCSAVQMQSTPTKPVAGFMYDPDFYLSLTAKAVAPPVMMFAHGCSLTTAGSDVMRNMLAAHGYKPAETGRNELIKSLAQSKTADELKSKTGYFGRTGDVTSAAEASTLKEKFKIVHEWAVDHQMTMVFKNERSIAKENDDLMRYLSKIGTTGYFFKRFNLIDILRCQVQDFGDINKGLGSLVDENGNEVASTFRGRGTDEKLDDHTTKVSFNLDHIVTALDGQYEHDKEHMEMLNKYNLASLPDAVSAEKLFEFEQGNTAESAKEWYTLLSSFGMEADYKKILEVFSSFGTFPAPSKHSATLYNFDALEEKLRGTRYYEMLRK